jgi:hypothetical protein
MDAKTVDIIRRYEASESRLLIDEDADWIVGTVRVQESIIQRLRKHLAAVGEDTAYAGRHGDE